MEKEEVLVSFFSMIEKSVTEKTFAKLTFAKTIGENDLKNVFVRAILQDDELVFESTVKKYEDGMKEIKTTGTLFEIWHSIKDYLGNPFLSAILFTSEMDLVLKINKKKNWNITEKDPTFRDASEVFED